jgi:hypothetical protein
MSQSGVPSSATARRCRPETARLRRSGLWVADRPMRSQGLSRHRCLQPLQRQRQMGAALGCHATRVDLVDDHALHAGQHARPDSEPSRMYSDSGVVTRMCGGRLRIATRSACGVSPVRTIERSSTAGKPAPPARGDAGQRRQQVQVDVVGQRLQRRHVDHCVAARPACRPAPRAPAVDRLQEGRQRLARTGRRRDQRVAARAGSPPRRPLRRRGRGELDCRKPVGDCGMEVQDPPVQGERVPLRWVWCQERAPACPLTRAVHLAGACRAAAPLNRCAIQRDTHRQLTRSAFPRPASRSADRPPAAPAARIALPVRRRGLSPPPSRSSPPTGDSPSPGSGRC